MSWYEVSTLYTFLIHANVVFKALTGFLVHNPFAFSNLHYVAINVRANEMNVRDVSFSDAYDILRTDLTVSLKTRPNFCAADFGYMKWVYSHVGWVETTKALSCDESKDYEEDLEPDLDTNPVFNAVQDIDEEEDSDGMEGSDGENSGEDDGESAQTQSEDDDRYDVAETSDIEVPSGGLNVGDGKDSHDTRHWLNIPHYRTIISSHLTSAA